MFFKLIAIHILDFFFLHPFFEHYYTSRIESIIMNNLSRNGLTVIKWLNDKNNEMVCFIYKYPEVNNVIVRRDIFEKFWPGMLENIKYISSITNKGGFKK